MDWLAALVHLREHNEIGVLATLAHVRGHAPRNAGAKMVLSATRSWGTIGGGNFEASVIDRALELMAAGSHGSEFMTFALNDKVASVHGVQCCGGEVNVLLEVLNPRRTVAIFGMGHVGYEIAHILARQPVNLVLVDSREAELSPVRLEPLMSGEAHISVRHEPAPEVVIRDLPAGATLLVLTHDHSEDLMLCEAALRTEPFYIGLIGSRSKWLHFRQKLREEGYEESEIKRITSPIGDATITGKDPVSIAIGVASDLLVRWEKANADT
ncbi:MULTISPECIES: xanthine dehydrogenase accessory protein XdhC [Arthrobacter]|uniref:xanthine dehydrogenase accessory protein XdhC n=1 Tax=unclassified Arthrobacter TaxID=235627 RepID=UPI0024BA8B82|nr:xanthine dehydrogenase accessory protein XdhC [Arthrobacter sp. H35-MC1]MDJ0316830.1 xanthine dehydrogenase accessory protein XdhC [Arthrobacter sp. H35-MC1]